MEVPQSVHFQLGFEALGHLYVETSSLELLCAYMYHK